MKEKFAVVITVDRGIVEKVELNGALIDATILDYDVDGLEEEEIEEDKDGRHYVRYDV